MPERPDRNADGVRLDFRGAQGKHRTRRRQDCQIPPLGEKFGKPGMARDFQPVRKPPGVKPFPNVRFNPSPDLISIRQPRFRQYPGQPVDPFSRFPESLKFMWQIGGGKKQHRCSAVSPALQNFQYFDLSQIPARGSRPARLNQQ